MQNKKQTGLCLLFYLIQSGSYILYKRFWTARTARFRAFQVLWDYSSLRFQKYSILSAKSIPSVNLE